MTNGLAVAWIAMAVATKSICYVMHSSHTKMIRTKSFYLLTGKEYDHFSYFDHIYCIKSMN